MSSALSGKFIDHFDPVTMVDIDRILGSVKVVGPQTLVHYKITDTGHLPSATQRGGCMPITFKTTATENDVAQSLVLCGES